MFNFERPYVTVFTPTFNRAYTLSRLYNSLLRQTDKSFEWLIVDDGSEDNTDSLVHKFIYDTEHTFNIRYFKKKNEGKHIAINIGAKEAKGILFFIVDSDDVLHERAIEKIIEIEKSIENKNDFAGVAGLRGNFKGEPIKSPTEVYTKTELDNLMRERDATSIEYRYKYKITGDRAEVVYTELMRQIPFPKIDNEKFMEESYLWMNLSNRNLKFRWFNSVIYLCEYLQDGLTNNMKEIVKKNWKTHCFCANYDLSIKKIPLKIRARECLRYYRYGLYGKRNVINLWLECNDKLLSIPAIFIAFFYKVK